VYEDIFLPLGSLERDLLKVSEDQSNDKVVYTFRAVRILARHVKALATEDTTFLARKLGESVVEDLKESPLDIFNSLPRTHKDLVAEFLVDNVVGPQKRV
jgi:hypothetical protein